MFIDNAEIANDRIEVIIVQSPKGSHAQKLKTLGYVQLQVKLVSDYNQLALFRVLYLIW